MEGKPGSDLDLACIGVRHWSGGSFPGCWKKEGKREKKGRAREE